MSYKRLTDKATLKTIRNEMNLDNPYYIRLAELEDKIEQGEFVSKDWHDEQIMHAENEIEEYKSKIENGTLIELPCKVGDTVYQVFHPTQVEPFPFTVEKIRVIIQADSVKTYVEEISGKGGTVGSTAFTRAEAEAKLAELKEKENEHKTKM